MFGYFEIAAATHVGKTRRATPNQDSIKVLKPVFFRYQPPLLIVADGMGGEAGGAQASKIVIDSLKRTYLKTYPKLSPRETLEESVLQAHQAICVASQKNQRLSNMGSTVVAAILENQHVLVINVGDSRLYIFRERQAHQVSLDQSVVAEKVRRGEITEEETLHHPQKNQLSMSITARRENVIPNYTEHSLDFNDVILLCSDGLWGTVPESLMCAIACQLKPSLAVRKLIDLANKMGGPDNISVIIARRKGSKLETGDEDEFGQSDQDDTD